MKKKYFSWIALLLMMCVVTGCGNSKTGQSTNTKVDDSDYYDNVPPTGMGFDLSNEDVFETGYYHVMFDTFSSAVIFSNQITNRILILNGRFILQIMN